MIFTDGLVRYRLLLKCGYRHEWVHHMTEVYVRGEVHTQTLDGFWGQLKNRLAMQGGIRKAYLPFFIGKHVWRYNFRHLSREKQIERLLEFFN
ncbi:MAG: transposase [Candidatus Moranbacteria bacterium]|nr:transposase [Candidatus Moranbacteria bacterium]